MRSSKKPARGSKKTERICVGCRQPGEKYEMIRISRKADGTMTLDPAFRSPGRGAYICRNRACIRLARRNHGLERSFKCGISKEDADRLFEEMERYIEEKSDFLSAGPGSEGRKGGKR